MFDTKCDIDVTIAAGDVRKVATVRFPTDAEWADRAAAQRTVIRSIGRGRSETEILNGAEVDRELFVKILLSENAAAFDDAEASAVIGRIARCEAGEAEHDGSQVRIPLSTAAGDTTHFMKVPSQKQVLDYGKAAVRLVEGRHRQELRLNVVPAGTLYDALVAAPACNSSLGPAYVDGVVPIIHKQAVIAELVRSIKETEDEPGNLQFRPSGRTNPASGS